MTVTGEISRDELFARTADPFVLHQVDRHTVERAWARGDAVVVQGGRHHPRTTRPGPVLTCLGPAADLGPLMHRVAATLDRSPGRVTMEQAARTVAPARWRYEQVRVWDWMWTRDLPTARPRHRVGEESDAARINAVLDAANPDSFARPGGSGVQVWLGVREGPRLVGVGALERMADGTGHLRGVSVLPELTGSGVGFAVSHALTVLALTGAAGSSGVATLGAYSDNAAALAIYARLGYRTAHRFYSGPVVPAPR